MLNQKLKCIYNARETTIYMYINTCWSKSEVSFRLHRKVSIPTTSTKSKIWLLLTTSQPGNTFKPLDSHLGPGKAVVGASFEAADSELGHSHCFLTLPMSAAGGHAPRTQLFQRHMARHTASSLCEVSAWDAAIVVPGSLSGQVMEPVAHRPHSSAMT